MSGATTPALLARAEGALLGLACGDAVGTTLEFKSRGSFVPITDMVGGGPFELKPGQWTDDTSMALCLAESLIAKGRFDAIDQMDRYVAWMRDGYLSSTGECFDIGVTIRKALDRYRFDGDPYAGSSDPQTAGNGALMRLAPAVLFGYPDRDAIQAAAVDSTRTTHAAAEALDCSRLLARVLQRALDGASKEALLVQDDLALDSPAVRDIASGGYGQKPLASIKGSGYAVHSLEASLWSFRFTHSFEEAVLFAANLGDDADTTAAITGQIAGAFYGREAIPAKWREKLYMADRIQAMAGQLLKC